MNQTVPGPAERVTTALETIGRIPADDAELRSPGDVADRARVVLDAAAAMTPWAACASITHRRLDRAPTTLVSNSETADVIDAAQYAARCGPCFDALTNGPGPIVCVADVLDTSRWPHLDAAEFPARLGMMATGVFAPSGERACLNLYFDLDADVELVACEPDVRAAAAVVGVGLSGLLLRSRADNLAVALESNRQIGAALGVLIAQNKWTYEQAFERLRTTSQNANRKLREVADEVVLTGALPPVPERVAVHTPNPHESVAAGLV